MVSGQGSGPKEVGPQKGGEFSGNGGIFELGFGLFSLGGVIWGRVSLLGISGDM